MKVFIISGIFPPDIGGPATYVPRIAEALSRRGHQVTVLTLSDHLGHDDTKYPFQVIRLLRHSFKPFRWLKTMWLIIQRGSGADVLYVNGLAMESVVANFILRKSMVQKVVGDLAWERCFGKGWVTDGFEEFQSNRYSLWIEGIKALRSWWVRRADKIIVPSRYLARWVTRWGVSEEKVEVIYNAVKPEEGLPLVEIPLNSSVRFVSVGRLISGKRIDRVMKAIAETDGTGLVVVGDGPEKERLKKAARDFCLDERVYFAGQRNKVDTWALMAACDIFVLYSNHEGLPHVILEAMNIGLPVVATDVGGTSEVVENGVNGLLIPRDNLSFLVNAFKELSSSPSARQKLARGAKATVSRFGFRDMVDRTESALSRCFLHA